ncbi:uncharacterized protein LOC143323613 [Chaetodon auriga]|uniref:uncharacterized protein LOC143323613 n=1 Tax=Chaetodon auriga TaxID=39042 RepID=UPI004032E592
MHQHTHRHALTPILHQPSTILPAPMGPLDSKLNMHLPRGTTRPSFVPVTVFHRDAQKSFRSTKRGRWGALHVCIAWKIYYQEQLKKMQKKPAHPSTSPPDSVQHTESDQTSNLGKTAENVQEFNRSYPSDLHTSSPCHSREREKLDWEKLEQPSNLHWKERLAEEKHRGQQADRAKDSPLRDKSWDPAVTPEPGSRRSGSLDRKRPLECDGFMEVKRMKQGIEDNQFDPSHTHPHLHTAPVQHISDLSASYPDSSRCNVSRAPAGLVSYTGVEMYPYQAASWEQMRDVHKTLDLHRRRTALKDYSVNTCKAIRVPLVAQRQKEAFHGFFAPPLYLPLALRQQETVYLRGREFLHSRHENCHLQCCRHQLLYPGFMATPYLGLQGLCDRKGEQLFP